MKNPLFCQAGRTSLHDGATTAQAVADAGLSAAITIRRAARWRSWEIYG
jgi:hypothetical protein